MIATSQYDVIMAAVSADDIPIGTQEWIDDGESVRSFTVQGHRIGNVVVFQFQDGTMQYMHLDVFKLAVKNA